MVVQINDFQGDLPDVTAGTNTLLCRFRESLEATDKAVQLQPQHFAAYAGMGLNHVQLKEYSKAISAFEAALRINPSLSQIQRYYKALKAERQ